MKWLLRFLAIIFIFFQTSCSNNKNKETPQLADTHPQSNCVNPDAGAACCFENMPESLTSAMIIAGDTEPGTQIKISGTIFQPDGKTPFNNIILYAYHTDAKGIYSKKGNEKGVQKYHGRLHGWCKTGKDGRYEIRTIRPASYPESKIPAHIHAAIMIPGTHRSLYIGDFLFADDPLLGKKDSEMGYAMEMKRNGNILVGKRDITVQ